MSSTSKDREDPSNSIQSTTKCPVNATEDYPYLSEHETSEELDENNCKAVTPSRPTFPSNQNIIPPKFDFHAAQIQKLDVDYDHPASPSDESDHTVDSSSDDEMQAPNRRYRRYGRYPVSKREVKIMKALRKHPIPSDHDSGDGVLSEMGSCSIQSKNGDGFPEDEIPANLIGGSSTQPRNPSETTSQSQTSSTDITEFSGDILALVEQQLKDMNCFDGDHLVPPRELGTSSTAIARASAVGRPTPSISAISAAPQQSIRDACFIQRVHQFDPRSVRAHARGLPKDVRSQLSDALRINERLQNEKFQLNGHIAMLLELAGYKDDELKRLRTDGSYKREQISALRHQVTLNHVTAIQQRDEIYTLQHQVNQRTFETIVQSGRISALQHQVNLSDVTASQQSDEIIQKNGQISTLQHQVDRNNETMNQQKAENSQLREQLAMAELQRDPAEISLRREELAMVQRLDMRDSKKMSRLENQVELDADIIMQLRQELDIRTTTCIGEVEALERKMRVKDSQIKDFEESTAAFVREVERLEEIIRQKDIEIEDLTL